MFFRIFRKIADQDLDGLFIGIADLPGGEASAFRVHGEPLRMFFKKGDREEIASRMFADIQDHAAPCQLREEFPFHLPPFHFPAVVPFLCPVDRGQKQVEAVPPQPVENPAQLFAVFRVDGENADAAQFQIRIRDPIFRKRKFRRLRVQRGFPVEEPAASPEI